MTARRWFAALIVAALTIATAAAAVGFGLIVLPYQTPGSQSVPLTVVAQNGPEAAVRFGPGTAVYGVAVYGSEAILASPSVADLSTLALALSGRPDECPDGNCWKGASVPKSSLLIALQTPAKRAIR